jgi:uracil-DNA glycosylase
MEPTATATWPDDIQQLIDALRSVPSSETMANPYDCPDRCSNLAAYLSTLRTHGYSGHLLVGEAPGYKGCAVTGIPFTSEAAVFKGKHAFTAALRPLVRLTGKQKEGTATIVWTHLETCGSVAAMWNAFPFHPHHSGQRLVNRRPSRAEVADAKQFLEAVIDILSPTTIVAVGGVAADGLRRHFPSLVFERVRHPSNGGKADFLAGIKALGIT